MPADGARRAQAGTQLQGSIRHIAAITAGLLLAGLVLATVVLVGEPVAAHGPGESPGSALAEARPAAAALSAVRGGTASLQGPPTPAASAAYAIPVYRHGSRTARLVALTFDDGFSPSATLRILQVLEREDVVATFFPYGWAVSRNASVWRRVADAGHPIANHTQSHRVLTRLSEAQVLRELTDARRTVERVTGKSMAPLLRPPGGAWNAATARAAKKAGIRAIVLWDVDPQDWRGLSARTISARSVVGTNGSIVLLHAGPAATASALRSIIRSYRSRGFEFVTVPQILGLEELPGAASTVGAGTASRMWLSR
jgi:peptidoglycan/xylan/chitin deacetylase (PgdA/CDA1 family)